VVGQPERGRLALGQLHDRHEVARRFRPADSGSSVGRRFHSLLIRASGGEKCSYNLETVGTETLEIIWDDTLNLERMKEAIQDKDLIFHFAALPSHRLAMKEPRNMLKWTLLEP